MVPDRRHEADHEHRRRGLEPIGELETGSDGFVQLAVRVGRFVRISHDPGQPYAALTLITLEKQ